VTEFAEAEGPKGAKMRTWLSVPDQPVFAVAGIWRDTEEWGPAYSMIMTEACIQVADVHDRMPVILRRGVGATGSTGRPMRLGCCAVLIPTI
jgi:putative SOS response-associated peptidase YedK